MNLKFMLLQRYIYIYIYFVVKEIITVTGTNANRIEEHKI